MNKLPLEILQKIFLLLHQYDKAVCMTVCRLWKHALAKSILFDTVCLYNKQQFNHFVSKDWREPNQREKIGRLIIDMRHMGGIKMDIPPLVILNLRELYFDKSVHKYDIQFTKSFSPQSWHNTIKRINEKSSNIFTTHILKGGECPNLAELKVHGASNKLGRGFIGLLVNAPALKSLSLKNCKVSLTDLELLHKTTPLLSSLALRNGAVDCTTLPTNIKPMIRIKKLTLEHLTVETTPKYINLQKYLAMKYPMVNELAYLITVDRNANVEYSIKTGFALQIKQIGAHLTLLKIINKKCFEYIIPVLDENDCRIKTITISSSTEASEVIRLAQSDQAQCIQSLSLYYISADSFINYIRALVVLTELNLYCKTRSIQQPKVEINMDKLLENDGINLVTLRIYRAKINFNHSAARKHLSLRYLVLGKSTMSRRADHFISQSFPNLRTLIIGDINWAKSTLYFGNLKLTYLELRYAIPSTNPYVQLVATSNGNIRWYTANPVPTQRRNFEADPNAFPAVKSYPFGQFNRLPCMTVVCASVYDFFLVNL